MSLPITFKVHGLRELEKALIELGSEVAGKNGGLVRTALMGAALPVLQDAKARAPRSKQKIGKSWVHMADTIVRSRAKEPDPEIKANEVIEVGLFGRGKGKRIFHGSLVEFGTTKMPARPFLRPALEQNAESSTKIFRTKLAGGIQRVAKKIGNKNAAAVGARVKKL
jgi:HK97 gp10 family phage protein